MRVAEGEQASGETPHPDGWPNRCIRASCRPGDDSMSENTEPSGTGGQPHPSQSPPEDRGSALPYCAQRPPIVRPRPTGVSQDQLFAILSGRSKWLNGTVLHYYFFGATDGSPSAW